MVPYHPKSRAFTSPPQEEWELRMKKTDHCPSYSLSAVLPYPTLSWLLKATPIRRKAVHPSYPSLGPYSVVLLETMATWLGGHFYHLGELMFQSLVLTALDSNVFFQSGTGASECSVLLKEESFNEPTPWVRNGSLTFPAGSGI